MSDRFIKIHDNIDKILTRSGGLPRGHLIEFYGPDGEGKSTFALLCIAAAQAQGIQCGLVDVEDSFVPEYAEHYGVCVEKLEHYIPDSGEEALNRAIKMCEEGYGLVVIDSVAGLVPESSVGEEVETGGQYAPIASLLSRALPKLRRQARLGNTCVLLLNQVRANIQRFGMGPATTSSSGYALKHFTSARFEIRKISWIKQGTEVIGYNIKIRAPKKNRLAVPNRDGTLEIICDMDAPPLEEINKRKQKKIEPITFKEE